MHRAIPFPQALQCRGLCEGPWTLPANRLHPPAPPLQHLFCRANYCRTTLHHIGPLSHGLPCLQHSPCVAHSSLSLRLLPLVLAIPMFDLGLPPLSHISSCTLGGSACLHSASLLLVPRGVPPGAALGNDRGPWLLLGSSTNDGGKGLLAWKVASPESPQPQTQLACIFFSPGW